LADLSEAELEIILDILRQHPALSPELAIEMARAAGM
jgi:hypothetical protein